jgi:hypothetical protein
MTTMKSTRPAEGEYAPHFAKYIGRVPEGDVLAHLAGQIDRTCTVLSRVTGEQSLFRYAPGKWSIHEVVGHLSDAERVFAYRALRISRGDATPLPSFDENLFVAEARFDRRTLDDLVGEFRDSATCAGPRCRSCGASTRRSGHGSAPPVAIPSASGRASSTSPGTNCTTCSCSRTATG